MLWQCGCGNFFFVLPDMFHTFKWTIFTFPALIFFFSFFINKVWKRHSQCIYVHGFVKQCTPKTRSIGLSLCHSAHTGRGIDWLRWVTVYLCVPLLNFQNVHVLFHFTVTAPPGQGHGVGEGLSQQPGQVFFYGHIAQKLKFSSGPGIKPTTFCCQSSVRHNVKK